MTIRLRLALWYGALLALVLGVTLSVAFAVHVTTHESSVDASLRASWEHTVRELALAGMPMHGVRVTAPAQAASAPTATWIVVPGQAPIAVGDTSDPVLARLDPTALSTGAQDAHGVAGRARTYAARLPGSDTRVVVAASMSAFDASVRALGLILALIGIASVTLAVTGGWVISAGALRPIARMTEAARAIALSRGFARRIDVHAERRDELSTLGRTFNQMLASLDDAYRRQQRFVADVSHELRTPLTAIQGDLDLLAERALPPEEVTAAVAEARRETRRLARLIDDLLVLARADSGPEPFIGRPVELDEVVMEAFRELRTQAGPRLRVVELEASLVHGERDRLKQLVLILIDNAISYTPAPGEVRVSLRGDGGQVVLRVEDDGIGISAATAARAFERFYRGEEAQRLDPAGTGLGLSIADWIVGRHGGTITLEPRDVHGTRVLVHLPLASSVVRAAGKVA